MRKLLITFGLFFLLISSCLADSSILLKSNKKIYDIDENIDLNIELKSDENKRFEIDIKNLDEFVIVSQKQSQRISNINWRQNSIVNFSLWLQAPKKWKYILWPASTNSGSIKSNLIEIEVKWERIMLNNNFPKNITNSWNLDEQENQNLDDIDLWIWNANNNPKKVVWVYGEYMEDIYEDKNFFLLWFYVFVLFALIIYLFYYIFIIIRNKNPKNTNNKLEYKKQEINYNKLLIDVEINFLDEKKDIFYAELNKVFRLFLDDKIKFGLSKKSLKEIKKHLENKQIIDLYERIYFLEYDKTKDTKIKRLELISSVKKLTNKMK